MAVNLNADQVAALQSFLQNAQYADAYRYLHDVVSPQIATTGDFAQSKDLDALAAWFDAAAHINADDGQKGQVRIKFGIKRVRFALNSHPAASAGSMPVCALFALFQLKASHNFPNNYATSPTH